MLYKIALFVYRSGDGNIMKKRMKRIASAALAAILIVCMTFTGVFAASYSDFNDVQGHWAESYLKRAVEDGILNGTSGTTLEPNGNLTGCQMAAMIVRSCGLQHFTKDYPGTTSAANWYYFEAAIAYSAGILPADASVAMDEKVTRGQVFESVKDTFFRDEKVSEGSETVLDKFADKDKLTDRNRDAAIVLIEKGVLLGDDLSCLNPDKNITRAEFAALLYRALDKGTKPEEPGSDRIKGLKLKLSAGNVEPGGDMIASLKASGVTEDFVCEAVWVYDRVTLSDYTNKAKTISEGTESSCSRHIEFSRNMPLDHRIGFLIIYRDPDTGQDTYVYTEKNVKVRNYPDSYYKELLYNEALATVSCKYSGKRAPDLRGEIKEAFVNGKGYSSKTGYLIWVNLATQKVNVFQGSKGSWTLIHTYNCSTGAPSTPTPVGVTYVTYKQSAWKTSSYIVRPITRFYPNTGYAFHSVLYSPSGSGKVIDGAMGYPASHGCVRTDEEGVWWIYYNIPVNTTVVIY